MPSIPEGKLIRAILVSDGWGCVTYPNKTADKCEAHAEWYGDTLMYWGIDYKDGIELRRWNLLTAQMIEWES